MILYFKCIMSQCWHLIYLLFTFSIGMSYSQAATFYLTASISIEAMISLIIELIATISHHEPNDVGDYTYNIKDIMANYIYITPYMLQAFILPAVMIKSTSSISTLSKMIFLALKQCSHNLDFIFRYNSSIQFYLCFEIRISFFSIWAS